MNQYLKMLLYVLIACWSLIIPCVLVQELILNHKYDYERDLLLLSVLQALIFSIPLVLLIYFMLLAFNAIMRHKAVKNGTRKWNKDYYLIGLLFVAVIPVALIVFDYTRYGSSLDRSYFFNHVLGYLVVLVFGFVILVINKKLFWKP